MPPDYVDARAAASVRGAAAEITEPEDDASQLLAEAVAHGAVGLMVVDSRGTVLATNQTLARWAGGAPDDLMGRPIWRSMAQISEASWPFLWAQLLDVGLLEFDTDSRAADGSSRATRTLIELQSPPGRSPRALVRIMPRVSVTPGETGPFDWFRCAAEYGEEGFWDWNVLTGRISVSRQWCTLFRMRPRNKITLETMRSILSPAGYEQLLADSARMARGEAEVSDAVVLARRLDGRPVWIRHRAYVASRTASGRVARIVGRAVDITEEREAAEALRDLVERVPVAVLVYQPDGTVRLWNRAVAELLGCRPEETLAEIERRRREGWDLLDEQGRPVPREGLPSLMALETGVAVRDRVYGVLPRGAATPRWGVMSALPRLNANGAVLDVVTTFTDITTHRRLEATLAKVRRLESLGRLAGGVAHDFNNMLTAIIGSAELIRMVAPDLPEVGEEVAEIVSVARRGSTLTRQLLGYARRQPMQARPILLGQTIRRAGALLDRVLGAGIEVVLPDHDDPMVRADPRQLEQVVLELAVNARESMEGRGTLTLAVDAVTVEPDGDWPEAEPGRYGRLRVIDDGPGMSPEVRARAFEPFFTTRGLSERTGLGLATCYGIVRQNDGYIRLGTGPEGGTSVELLLPGIER